MGPLEKKWIAEDNAEAQALLEDIRKRQGVFQELLEKTVASLASKVQVLSHSQHISHIIQSLVLDIL